VSALPTQPPLTRTRSRSIPKVTKRSLRRSPNPQRERR
jgi:hypothetical protein